MKRLLLLCMALLLCVSAVSASTYNFQRYTNGSFTTKTVGGVWATGYYMNATSGEVYVNLDYGGSSFGMTSTPVTFDYAAFDLQATGGASSTLYFAFYDSAKASISSVAGTITGGHSPIAEPNRVEVFNRGGTGWVYMNGVHLGNMSPVMGVNPAYFSYPNSGFLGGTRLTNIVVGGDDHHAVAALPSNWSIVKDNMNALSTGVYADAATTPVLKNQYFFYINADTDSQDATTTENLIIQNSAGTTINTTAIDSTVPHHLVQYNVLNFLAEADNQTGIYSVHFDGSGQYDYFQVTASGATVSFDKGDYGQTDIATMTYSISGTYWDTSTYAYRLDLIDGLTGDVVSTNPISSSSGSFTYQFTDADTEGAYYSVVIASPNSNPTLDYWMNTAYATLNGYVTFQGYVNNAQTGAVISGANVNITQGSIIGTSAVPASGYYSYTNYVTGASVTVNATASGYRRYAYTFTPLKSKTVSLNISLIPNTPAVSDVAIGGVIRNNVYGQPISGATGEARNTTHTITATSSMTGYYLLNNTLNLSYYDVHGSKASYTNSSLYNASVNGGLSNFTETNITMSGEYLQTFRITDKSTSLPIPVVSITDSQNRAYNTTNGTGYLTTGFEADTVIFRSDGYTSRAIAYVFDSDETHDVQLTASTPQQQNTNIIYTQRLVRLRAVDMYSRPLVPVTITVAYIASTLPGNNVSFLQGAFGISADIATTMMDSGVAMSGITGNDGSNTFMLFPALTYNVTISNATMGVSCQQNLAPADSDYVLYCPTDTQKTGTTTIASQLNMSKVWASEPNASYVNINSTYKDPQGKTTSLKFNVTCAENGTVLYYRDLGNPGTSQVFANYTMLNIRGLQIKAYLTYDRSP